MKKYRVEIMGGEDSEGRIDWVLAARRHYGRQKRKMSYGPASSIGADEAIDLLNTLIRSGSDARIVKK